MDTSLLNKVYYYKTYWWPFLRGFLETGYVFLIFLYLWRICGSKIFRWAYILGNQSR